MGIGAKTGYRLPMSSNIESKVQKQPLWEVYMVRTVSGKLYTGITIDLARRWDEHSGTARGAKFFRSDPPEAIVYREVLGLSSRGQFARIRHKAHAQER